MTSIMSYRKLFNELAARYNFAPLWTIEDMATRELDEANQKREAASEKQEEASKKYYEASAKFAEATQKYSEAFEAMEAAMDDWKAATVENDKAFKDYYEKYKAWRTWIDS